MLSRNTRRMITNYGSRVYIWFVQQSILKGMVTGQELHCGHKTSSSAHSRSGSYVTPAPEGIGVHPCLESRWLQSAWDLQNQTSPGQGPGCNYLNSCMLSTLRTTEFKEKETMFSNKMHGSGVNELTCNAANFGGFFYMTGNKQRPCFWNSRDVALLSQDVQIIFQGKPHHLPCPDFSSQKSYSQQGTGRVNSPGLALEERGGWGRGEHSWGTGSLTQCGGVRNTVPADPLLRRVAMELGGQQHGPWEQSGWWPTGLLGLVKHEDLLMLHRSQALWYRPGWVLPADSVCNQKWP